MSDGLRSRCMAKDAAWANPRAVSEYEPGSVVRSPALPTLSPWRTHQTSRNDGTRSDQAELHLADFADHRLVPWWVPDEFHLCVTDTRDAEHLGLGFRGDGRAHATTGRGKGHLHFHLRPGV